MIPVLPAFVLVRVARCILVCLLAPFLLLPALAQGASADCDISLKGVKIVRFSGTRAYDIYSPVETAQTVFFSVDRKQNSGLCTYFITFSKGQAGSYERAMAGTLLDMLYYQIYDSPTKVSVLKDIPEAWGAEVLGGSFLDGSETHEHSYYIVIPPEQSVVDGRYEDTILLSLYDGTLTNFNLQDSASVTIRTEVDESLQICVVDCGAAFDPFSKSRTMNFGILQAGAYRELDLLVRGTTDYEVEFSSDNRGSLAHATSRTSIIPYILTINGAIVDLGSNKVTIGAGTGPLPAEGIRYEMNVTIGSLGAVLTGEYSDVISITVRSL